MKGVDANEGMIQKEGVAVYWNSEELMRPRVH